MDIVLDRNRFFLVHVMDLTCTTCCVRCTRAEFLTVIESTGSFFRVNFQNSNKNIGGKNLFFLCVKNHIRGHSPGLRYSCHSNAIRVLSQLPKITRSIVNTFVRSHIIFVSIDGGRFVNVRK